MKSNREFVKRIEAAKKKLEGAAQKKFVMKDFDGLYYCGCGSGLTQEQFEAWTKQQELEANIVVFEYSLKDSECAEHKEDRF